MPLSLSSFIGYMVVKFFLMSFKSPELFPPRATRQNSATEPSSDQTEPSSDQTEYSSTSSSTIPIPREMEAMFKMFA